MAVARNHLATVARSETLVSFHLPIPSKEPEMGFLKDFGKACLEGVKQGLSSDNRAINDKTLKDLSLSCNVCGTLAAPIYATSSNYHCLKCGRQFSGIRHNVSSVMRPDSYTAALERAKGNKEFTIKRVPISRW